MSGIVNTVLGFSRILLNYVPSNTVLPILTGPARGMSWVKGAGVNSIWLGRYERSKQFLLQKHLLPRMVFWDIGANSGFYTLLASRLVGKSGRVVSVEPDAENIDRLNKHLKLNRISNVEVLAIALSNYTGQGAFKQHESKSMGRLSWEGMLSISVDTVDRILENNSAPAPDVVKIDVEGEELNVLRGMEKTIDCKRPTIFVATHSADVHQQIIRYLTNKQYLIYDVNGGSVDDTDELIAIPKR